MSKTSSAILCLLVLLAAPSTIMAIGETVQAPSPAGSTSPMPAGPTTIDSIDNLPREKQVKAMAIVEDSLPTLRSLDMQIGLKMQELSSMTFDSDESPQALPKLGMELQRLREELRKALNMVNLRLQNEVGVSMQVPAKGGVRTMRDYCQPQRYAGGRHHRDGHDGHMSRGHETKMISNTIQRDTAGANCDPCEEPGSAPW